MHKDKAQPILQYQRDCMIFWEDYLYPQKMHMTGKRYKLRELFHKGYIEPQSIIILESNSKTAFIKSDHLKIE